MIDRAIISQIIDTAQIVEVVGEFVTLKRRGANYMACCPFHNEKTPSFSVSPAKGIYKCFGCGKAGNVVNFVMEHEQLSYVEALKYLGRKYGITVEEEEEGPEAQANRLKHEAMMNVSAFAQKYYIDLLWNSPMGKAVGLSYFRERDFTDATIRTFQLGFAPNTRDAFTKAALAAGYPLDILVSTGLSILKEETHNQPAHPDDRFYDRVLFPIHSLSGRVIAFGGRTLRSDKAVAKYINSPESEIYSKSRSLYGLFFAKQAITRTQKCYLVEGYTDVLSLYQAGIENVVASSGTSLTTDQIRLIKRFAPLVTVLYDGDAAGIKASLRGIDMLLEEGLQVKVVLFPDGEDPDSYARNHSPQETLHFLNQSEQDFITFKINLLLKEGGQDPLKRAQLINDVVYSISVIPDAITRTVYMEESARRLGIEEGVLVQEVAAQRRKRIFGDYHQNIFPNAAQQRPSGQYLNTHSSGSQLREAQLHGTQLREAQMSESQLREAQLREAQMSESQLSESQPRGSQLREAQFSGSQLREVQMSESQLHGSQLHEAQFSGTQLHGTQLSESQLSESQLYGSQLFESSHIPVPSFITQTYCATAEKDLIYWLLKFGQRTLFTRTDEVSGEMNITVAQYITAELCNDELEFQNLIYKNIFDEYSRISQQPQQDLSQQPQQDISQQPQQDISQQPHQASPLLESSDLEHQKYFINHPDIAVAEVALELLDDRHPITIKHFRDTMVQEEDHLAQIVPKAVLVYKSKITGEAYNVLCANLKKAQAAKNEEQIQTLMEQIRILLKIRNAFSRELKRLTL